MRRWTAAALAAQKQLAARLSRQGVQIVPDFVYTRTLNGFSAALDARALALLERDEDVVGVYPVRVAYPDRRANRAGAGGASRRAAAATASARLPGFDGAGVTIALLDTGVDATHPALRGRLLDGDRHPRPERPRDRAARTRTDPSQLERHGTQIAGLLVGRSVDLTGIAPGAIAPARSGSRAGSRAPRAATPSTGAPTSSSPGSNVPSTRTRTGAPSTPPGSPWSASQSRSPRSRTARWPGRSPARRQLDTLVVVPAGNDGPAGPGYGSVAGPGGAPDALTVGAADGRRRTSSTRVVVRAGLRILLDRELSLAGAVVPNRALTLSVVRPAAEAADRDGRRAARALLRRGRLQPRRGSRRPARARVGARGRRAARRNGGCLRDPRRRARARGGARP